MSLQFNSFRSQRYLRTRFIEGRFLLSSEATDLELELIDKNRQLIRETIGDVSVDNSWKTEKYRIKTAVTNKAGSVLTLDTTVIGLIRSGENIFKNGSFVGNVSSVDVGSNEITVSDASNFSSGDDIEIQTKDSLLVRKGESWYQGLPYIMESAEDSTVSGSSLALGITVGVGGGAANVSVQDDPSNQGKIVTFNSGGTTPAGSYRIAVSAREEVVTSQDDPFLKNVNIPESTAQKLRLVYRINVVPTTSVDDTPIPYVGSNDGNVVNEVLITPQTGGEGSEVSRTPITASQAIDGRDLEITFKNTAGVNRLPIGSAEQQEYTNGVFVDSVGNRYHLNLITNGTSVDEIVVRLDKAVGQADPKIVDGQPYKIIKRDVFVTDDATGNPQGRLFFPLSQVDLKSGTGFDHKSTIQDLRNKVISKEDFQSKTNSKFDLKLTEGGTIGWEVVDTGILDWSADLNLVSPHSPDQSIPSNQIALLDNSSAVYSMDLENGGIVSKGNLTFTSTTSGTQISAGTPSPDFSQISVGNILKVGSEIRSITAVNDISKTITVNSAVSTTGTVTVYQDVYAFGFAPLDSNTFCLATRKNNSIYFSNIEVESGESTTLGSGIPQAFVDYVGAPDEQTANPDYSGLSGPFVVTQGVSLTEAIEEVDKELDEINAILSEEIYDERQLFPSGITANTVLIIPVNTRKGSTQQTYDQTVGELEIYTNGRFAFQGEIWEPESLTEIKILVDLPNDTEIHYRIDAIGGSSNSGVGGPGGDNWGDPVDSSIIPNVDDTYDLGSPTLKFKDGYFSGELSVAGESTFENNVIVDGQNEFQFKEDSSNGNNYVALKAPASITTNVTFTLPDADGSSGQVIKTDGSGNLDWVSPFVNPMTKEGDLILGGTSGTANRLPVGKNNEILRSDGTTFDWEAEDVIAGGSGLIEKNYISNPSARVNVDGWTSIGGMSVSRNAIFDETPRETTTDSGLEITSFTSSAGDYTAFAGIDIDEVDKGKKFKVQFAVKPNGYNDDFNIEIFDNDNNQTLTVTNPHISNQTYIHISTFELPSNTTSIDFRIVATFAGFSEIVISDVLLGANATEATGELLGLMKKNKFQTKTLSSPVTNTGDISELTFNNLTVGKTYRITGQISLESNNSTTLSVKFYDGSSGFTNLVGQTLVSNTGTEVLSGISFIYTATNTTMTTEAAFGFDSNNSLLGLGDRGQTYLQIEELNNIEETTDFT